MASNGRTHIRPKAILDRIIRVCVRQERKGRAVGILLHGVISLAVAAAGWVGGGSPGEYAAVQFLPSPRQDRFTVFGSTPVLRRDAVLRAMKDHPISKRRACGPVS